MSWRNSQEFAVSHIQAIYFILTSFISGKSCLTLSHTAFCLLRALFLNTFQQWHARFVKTLLQLICAPNVEVCPRSQRLYWPPACTAGNERINT